MNVTLAFERCCVTKMRFTRVCMGTLQVCFKYLKFNVLWIKLTYLSCRILCCFTVFEAVLKRFQQVSAGGGVPLEKNTRLAGSELNHHTAKAKIFLRNGRSRFKSQSAEVWIPRFPVRRWLVHKSQCNGLKIAPLPAQICLSCCCIMRIANGEDTRFENWSLVTAFAQQKQHLVGVGRNYCQNAYQNRARVHCIKYDTYALNAFVAFRRVSNNP